MNKRWLVKENARTEEIARLSSELKIEAVLANILLQRGIKTYAEAEAFFRPDLTKLHDPLLMKNMALALKRLDQALVGKEKVLLFGDYDVDGTSAVAVLWNALNPHFDGMDFYIPDRYQEGYGVSRKGVEFAHEHGFTLIIALDCGVKAHEQIQHAKSLGIDFIVCDHHEPGETLPDAIILDPKQRDCTYPYNELSGCGVGFKLLQAFYKAREWDEKILWKQLDLLAISIAADLVPITDENRIFCFYGLQLINQKPRVFIQEMLLLAKKDLPLTLTNVVFIIAPRINAAGRIHEGKKAVQLMISEDREEIRSVAESIEQDNIERRLLDQEITKEALEQIAQDSGFPDRKSTVVFHESWHKGVIGIVASRLIEQHYRPTIVLTQSNGKLTGSGRSISGFNLHDALEACSDCLEQFGGHAFAAGMTMLPEKLDLFKEKFEEQVGLKLQPSELVPQQVVDYELQFEELFLKGENTYSIPKFKRILNQLEPHGPGNMKPVFVSKNVYVEDVRLLKEAHLKMTLSQPGSAREIQAIGFNLGDKIDLVLSKVPLDILYTVETNVWNNQETLQLNLKDIRSTF